MSLERARARVMSERFQHHGVVCPCCDQLAKAYRRPITSTMARWLIALVRRWRIDPSWRSVHDNWSLAINRGGGDPGKLRHWGLIEPCPKDPKDTTKRTSGLWRPTHDGELFVDRKLALPRYAVIYDSECLELTGELVQIDDALGTDFDYEALMRNEL